MAKISKNKAAARAAFEGKSNLSVEDAVALVKANTKAKFDETVEIAMNLGVDPRHADQMVRGVVTLPNGTGKHVRVAVFARGPKADEAKAAGAEIVGAEDLLETIQSGKIEFDRCIATPDMMPLVGRLGKILGPRNLMPNPKLGTVTPNVTEAVRAAKAGQVQFRVEKAGIVHAGIGKDHTCNENALTTKSRANDFYHQTAPPLSMNSPVGYVALCFDLMKSIAATGVICQFVGQGLSTSTRQNPSPFICFCRAFLIIFPVFMISAGVSKAPRAI